MADPFGDGIPIPDVIDPPDSMPMTLCIPKNRDHMSAFFGALYQLTVWNSWQQDGTQHGKELAAVWWRYYLSWNRVMNDLECEDGMDCCTEPAIIKRINPTTGEPEQSTDGGNTWKPAANGFPSVIVQPVPPVTSGVAGTKCDAATNVAGQVDVWISKVSDDFTTATTLLDFGLAVIGAIAAAVLTVLTDGVLLPVAAQTLVVLGAALNAVWGVGKATFDAYWTTDIKDKILCAAYCNISTDGSFTPAQFSAFWNKVNEELPPSPAKMLFMGFLSSVGNAGLNAMAASGMAADSDCADCDCGEPCSIDIWQAALWYMSAYYPPGNANVKGIEIARDATSITIQTQDRGDGQQVLSMTTPEGTNFCGFTAEFIGSSPAHAIWSFNYDPDHAEYTTLTPDGTAPFSHAFSMVYLQADPGVWNVKFTITP